MSQESRIVDSSTQRLSLENLYLDPNNFRLIHEIDQVEVSDQNIKDKDVIQRTFRLLAGDRNQNINDLIESFKANGYLPVDQIQVRELSPGDYVVVEGNRRIAALKFLNKEYVEKNIDLGQLVPSIFSSVPVVLYTDADEIHHLTLMALKHISGNKKWGEWNQAKLLEKMSKIYKIDEGEICRRIGISKIELRRNLRALSLVDQYQKSDFGDQFNESKFPIFREAAKNSALKTWLEWDDTTFSTKHYKNTECFFSLLSREPVDDTDDEEWINSNNKFLEPAITKRDDIRLFGEILNDDRALEQLIQHRDLNAAYRASDLVFKDKQESTIKSVSSDLITLSQLSIDSKQLHKLENALGKLQGIVNRTRGSGLSGVEQKTVFHDRVDCHYTSLNLESYKKLCNLSIEKISKINLFAGFNNSGKTTLLEAIYLLTRQNDFAGILEVIRRRGKIPEDHINPEWLVKQLSNNIKISGIFDKKQSSVSIRNYSSEDGKLDKSRYLTSVEITTNFGSEKQESTTHIFEGRERQTEAESIKLLSQVVYSSPFFLNEPHQYASFYHKSVQSKSLPIILKFIKEKVLPTLNDVRLVDDLQRFEVDDSIYPLTMDLMNYGEGLQRIFFISLLFASAQNGVVLIDEFENAIHTDLISKFAPFVHELALIFNVQVFLTSHSKECIDAFVKNVPTVDDFAYYALVEADNKIEVRSFSGKGFQKLLAAGNVDLRRAK